VRINSDGTRFFQPFLSGKRRAVVEKYQIAGFGSAGRRTAGGALADCRRTAGGAPADCRRTAGGALAQRASSILLSPSVAFCIDGLKCYVRAFHLCLYFYLSRVVGLQGVIDQRLRDGR
jgi:hypothetical protein